MESLPDAGPNQYLSHPEHSRIKLISWINLGHLSLLPLPEDKENSSCSYFLQPPHSPAIANWMKVVKRPTSISNSGCPTFFLTSYQNLLFVTAFELKDEIFECEKKYFQSPQYFAISASLFTGPTHQVLSNLYFPISSNKVIKRNMKDPAMILGMRYFTEKPILPQSCARHTEDQHLPHQETLVSWTESMRRCLGIKLKVAGNCIENGWKFH